MAEFERERKMMEDLEARLENIHEDHMNNLLATRVQSGARELFARRQAICYIN
jgi:hypothetical protein